MAKHMNTPPSCPPLGKYGLKFPLHAATRTGDIDAMTQLLDGGAEVDTIKDGATPLFVACEHGYVSAVRLLLERGAGVDGAAKDTASSAGVGAARLLQAQGAENDRNEGCRTPLLAASANGHSDVVRLLLEWGAGVDLATERGATPLSIARARGYVDVERLLAERGARTESIPDFYDFSSLLGPTLKTKSAGDVPTRQVLGGEEVIGIFFSGHWCPPSRRFTPCLLYTSDAPDRRMGV